MYAARLRLSRHSVATADRPALYPPQADLTFGAIWSVDTTSIE